MLVLGFSWATILFCHYKTKELPHLPQMITTQSDGVQPPELASSVVFGLREVTLLYDEHFLMEALRNMLGGMSNLG